MVNIETGQVLSMPVSRDTWSPEVFGATGNSRANSEISVASWYHPDENNNLHPSDKAFMRYVVENMTGLPVDAVWSYEFEFVVNIIDSFFPNGIEITVNEEIPASQDKRAFAVGTYTVRGADILDFARSRKTTSGESRERRQAYVIEIFLKQVLSLILGQGGIALEGLGGDLLGNNTNEINTMVENLFGSPFSVIDSSLSNQRGEGPNLDYIGLNPAALEILAPEILSKILSRDGLSTLAYYAANSGLDLDSFFEFNTIHISQTNPNTDFITSQNSAQINTQYSLQYWAPVREDIAENLLLPVTNITPNTTERSSIDTSQSSNSEGETSLENTEELTDNNTENINWSEDEDFTMFLESNFDISSITLNSETRSYITKYFEISTNRRLTFGEINSDQADIIQTSISHLEQIGGSFHVSGDDRGELEQEIVKLIYGENLSFEEKREIVDMINQLASN